ncbi:hypothetical protein GOODEAATRI_005762 [Goodea atripinnis]|uniref:Uncharacterized protein n=1 Tax=Goodea atripinnis TaxID=208336 RepID=A0ABV0NI60_9TELE
MQNDNRYNYAAAHRHKAIWTNKHLPLTPQGDMSVRFSCKVYGGRASRGVQRSCGDFKRLTRISSARSGRR